MKEKFTHDQISSNCAKDQFTLEIKEKAIFVSVPPFSFSPTLSDNHVSLSVNRP